MSAITSTVVRAGLRRGIQANAFSSACQKRSVSWMPWEPDWAKPKLTLDQDDPVFNLPPPEDTTSKAEDKKLLTEESNTQAVRKVGEAVVAPATTTVGAGTQEVSTSGKTVPPSIQAGSVRIPSTQSRSMHTASGSAAPSSAPALLHLPTTLLRIPDMPSTWPGETPPHPDQPRVRKRRMELIHAYTSTPQPFLPDSTGIPYMPSPHVLHALFPSIDTDPNPSLTFEKAVAKYMDGIKAREEALVAVEESADPEISRQVLAEVEEVQWRRVVWAALENLPKFPEKNDKDEGKEKGKGKGKKRA
ncbi:hypothetical protein ABKA04_000940 [Annulohypoxylon sp. FPYF3050]